MRIVIAEDSVLLLDGLTRLLEAEGHEVTGYAPPTSSSPPSGRADDLPDVLVTDVRMPPTHTDEGLRAAVHLRSLHPRLPVLVLSQYVEQRYASELLRGRRARPRLRAQGPRGRRGRVPRRARPGRRAAGPCSTPRSSPSCWPAAAAPASTPSRRASATCSASWPRAARTRRSPTRLVVGRRRRREARDLHPHQARPPAGRRRPPPRARGAALARARTHDRRTTMTTTLERPAAPAESDPAQPRRTSPDLDRRDRRRPAAGLRRLQRRRPAGRWGPTTRRRGRTVPATRPRPWSSWSLDGHITVTTCGDRVEVERTATTALTRAHYSVDELADQLRVQYLCDWWRPGFCSASLDVTVPDGTSRESSAPGTGSVTATGLSGPLDVHTSDGDTDVSDIDGDVTVRAADGRTDVADVSGSVSVSSRTVRSRSRTWPVRHHPLQRRSHRDLGRPRRRRRARERRGRHGVRDGEGGRSRHLHGRRRPTVEGLADPSLLHPRADPRRRRSRGLPATTRLSPIAEAA